MEKAKCLPTVRGWLALLAGSFCFFFPWTWPLIYAGSALTMRLMTPVPPWICVIGGAFVLLGAAISITAFVRGSVPDKVCACLGVLMVSLLVTQLYVLSAESRATNQRIAADAGIALILHTGRRWSRSADSGR